MPAGKAARPVGDRLAVSFRQSLNAVRRQRLDACETLAIACGAENAGDAAGKRGQRGAETERAGEPIDEDRFAGPGPALRKAA